MKMLRYFLFVFCLFAILSCSKDNTTNPPVNTDLPARPQNLKAESGESEVTLTWDNSAGAKSYNVYYSTSLAMEPDSTKKIENAVSPYTVKSLTNKKLYYFTVSAVNSAGESERSDMVSSMPIAYAKGLWRGKTDTTKTAYVDILMNLDQSGITVSGTAKCDYYLNGKLSSTINYSTCTGTLVKSDFRITFSNSEIINDYVATVLVSTERMTGTLTSSKLINGQKVTETSDLVLKKVQ